MCPIGVIKSLFTYKGKTYGAVKAKILFNTIFELGW